MTGDDPQRIAEGYRAFVREAAPESPVYSALAAAVADDSDVLAFPAALPPGKRTPPLFLAALRFLGGVPAGRGRPAPEGEPTTRTGCGPRC